MITQQQITDGFHRLGVQSGEILLVHSSLKSFGQVAGGADAVIDGLLDALGPEGTLLAPTLTGHEKLSPENPPHVDLRTAPCWVGIIPETLRQRPEAVRSTHPTHSCAAIGARAEELTRDHHASPTPCGVTSPYYRVAEAGGRIAMAGCPLDTCTTFHTIEELANVPYHLQPEVAYGTCIDRHGNRVDTPCLLHSYEGPERNFPVVEPLLLENGQMHNGHVGASTIHLLDAMGLIETALERIRFDPYYLTVLGKGNQGTADRG